MLKSTLDVQDEKYTLIDQSCTYKQTKSEYILVIAIGKASRK